MRRLLQRTIVVFYVAYFCVHSRAILLNPWRSFLNFLAISGTRGSSGLGSVSNEQMDNKTLEIVSAGLCIEEWLGEPRDREKKTR